MLTSIRLYVQYIDCYPIGEYTWFLLNLELWPKYHYSLILCNKIQCQYLALNTSITRSPLFSRQLKMAILLSVPSELLSSSTGGQLGSALWSNRVVTNNFRSLRFSICNGKGMNGNSANLIRTHFSQNCFELQLSLMIVLLFLFKIKSPFFC